MPIITNDIITVANSLSKDEVAAIPTETVYGLAGNIFSEKAIHSIFRIKQRPLFNPLIVHLPDVEAIDLVAKDIPDMARELAKKYWPGPLTLLLPKKELVPDLITAGKTTVAVRVPNHSVTLALLKQLPFPLAAPSANPFGSISPTTSTHVANYFKDDFPYILEGGACSSGIESTIIGFNEDGAIIYRYGSLAAEDIETITGPLQEWIKDDTTPNAPGMLLRHYAPNTEIVLTDNIAGTVETYAGKKIGLLTFSKSYAGNIFVTEEILSERGSFEEAAKNLYAAMHKLDQQELDIIIAERLPSIGLGRSINDRLERATHHKI